MDVGLKIKMGLAVVVLGLWLYGWLKLKALKADNERLKQAATLAENEAKLLQKEIKSNHLALAERELRRAELSCETEALKDDFEKAYAGDESSAAWADTPVPSAVRDRLRK